MLCQLLEVHVVPLKTELTVSFWTALERSQGRMSPSPWKRGFSFLKDQVQQQPLKIKAPVPLNASFPLHLILEEGKAERGSGELNLCPHEEPLLCGLWLFFPIAPVFLGVECCVTLHCGCPPRGYTGTAASFSREIIGNIAGIFFLESHKMEQNDSRSSCV